MAQRLAQGLWVIGDFSDSLPEVKAEQEGSFFSMLYYKNCLNYALPGCLAVLQVTSLLN